MRPGPVTSRLKAPLLEEPGLESFQIDEETFEDAVQVGRDRGALGGAGALEDEVAVAERWDLGSGVEPTGEDRGEREGQAEGEAGHGARTRKRRTKPGEAANPA